MSRPPSPPSLLGIDSGLTVTKAVVFDLDGRALGVGSAPARNRVLRSRWVEKDPTQQWHDTAGAVRTAIAAAGVDPASIEAVGLTGHGDGVYLIGEDGLPVRPALPSLDTRAHEVVARWRRNGVADRALALAGELPFPQHAPAMLVWLREHEPGVLERTRWVLSAKDWLKLQLTGTVTTDPTDASAGFTDVRGQGYAPALRALYGLEEVEGKLPPIVPPTEPVGQVRPEAAAETGIPAGTPVPSGLHDIAAASVGSGATEPGEMLMVAGTYSVNQVLGDRPVVDGRWLCRSWLRPGRWAHMSTSPTSATNTEWFVRQLCPEQCEQAERAGASPFAFVDEEAGQALRSGRCPVFHPFLFGSPHGDGASAAFLGLRSWHTRGHLLLGLLQGIVFNHRTHIDPIRALLPSTSLRLAGGATRSLLWSQLFADVLGLPVSVADAPEAGALGAALCAGVAAGRYACIEDAVAQAVRVARRHQPDPARTRELEDEYGVYLDTVRSLQPLWPRLP